MQRFQIVGCGGIVGEAHAVAIPHHVPQFLQETVHAVNAIGIPWFAGFHRTEKHFIQAERVGAIALHNVVEEGIVALHHIVGGHVQGYDASGIVGHLHSPADKCLVLDKIAFNVEIVMTFEILRLEVFRHKVEGCAQVHRKGALRITSADEDHGTAAGVRALEQMGFHTVLLLVALEEQAQLVISDFPYETGRHSENRRAGDGVGSAAACDIFYAERLQCGPDFVACFHVDVLHAAFRQMIGLQKCVVRKDCKNVREGITDSKD